MVKLDENKSHSNESRQAGAARQQGPSGSNLDLEDIVRIANKIGLEYANAKKKAEHLDLLKATKRAQAMIKYDDGKRSEAKIKRLAEADEQYVDHLIQLSDAKSEAEKLKIRYESYKNLFEAKRSLLSYQKEEMKLY